MTEKTYIYQTKEHIIKENKFREAISKAQTSKEFREAVMLLPDYKPTDKLLTKENMDELRQAARSVLESKGWNELSWDDAWSGKYPKEITAEDENKEIENLLRKYLRIIDQGITNEEFVDSDEHIRFLVLERCSFLDVWQTKTD